MKISVASRRFDDALLEPLRQVGDAPADAVIEAVAQRVGRQGLQKLLHFLGDVTAFDLSGKAIEVQDFFEEMGRLPAFANPTLMRRGMAFFWRHEVQIPLILACYSLPYCYAAANGAQVLWLSERIKKDTQRRLEETGEFVFGIMQERDWENGRNIIKVLKIRLMHAVVRYFTRHAPQWNEAWGLPINQEDMAGTNLAFSYIVIRGLRKLNYTYSANTEEAYLHFWNVVGYLLGVDETLLPQNLREAFHLDNIIAKRQFRPSVAGSELTKALMQAFQKEAVAQGEMKNMAAPFRFFLGETISDLLAVPPISTQNPALFGWFLRFSSSWLSPRSNSNISKKFGRKAFVS